MSAFELWRMQQAPRPEEGALYQKQLAAAAGDDEAPTPMQRAREALGKVLQEHLLPEADRCTKCRVRPRQHVNPYCEDCALEEGAL